MNPGPPLENEQNNFSPGHVNLQQPMENVNISPSHMDSMKPGEHTKPGIYVAYVTLLSVMAVRTF